LLALRGAGRGVSNGVMGDVLKRRGGPEHG